jgi:uncharacterized protein
MSEKGPSMDGSRVLLLHGVGHRRPTDHWLWWLAEQLRAAHIPVQYPQMPDPDDPDPVAWAEIAKAELGMLTAGNGPTVVVAHSLGTVLWAHLAETLPTHLLPSRVALVSPATRPQWSEAAPKFADIRLGSLSAIPTVIVGRSSDWARNVPLAELAASWGAPSEEIQGEGHLTPADGHGPFPGALAWVLGGPDEAWAGPTNAGSPDL